MRRSADSQVNHSFCWQLCGYPAQMCAKPLIARRIATHANDAARARAGTRRLHRLYLSVCPHRPAHRPLGLVSADDDRADPELRHALGVRVRALAGRRRSAQQLTVDVSRSGPSLHTIACGPTFPQILLATMWIACAYPDQAFDPKGFPCVVANEAFGTPMRRDTLPIHATPPVAGTRKPDVFVHRLCWQACGQPAHTPIKRLIRKTFLARSRMRHAAHRRDALAARSHDMPCMRA